MSSGLVSFALGTDNAGSGRVPAAFCHVVGLKPTRGLISTAGVVPACRSLDCVSNLALTVPDAAAVLAVATGPDPLDPYARVAAVGSHVGYDGRRFRFGVPDRLEFFGDAAAGRLYDRAIRRGEAMGGSVVSVPFAPFVDTAQLLYEGPRVAERLAVVEALLARHPEALLPVTRGIIERGSAFSAVDAFRAFYRLEGLCAHTRHVWERIDCLVVPPTTPTIYRIAEVEAEPLRLNTRLGFYTDFVNLLDLAALAVPNGFDMRGLPAGVTLIAPAFRDRALIHLATAFHTRADLPLGATGHRLAG